MAGLSFPASELGTTFGPTLSKPEETQMIGAFIVFSLFLVWLARFHFKEMVVHTFQPMHPGSNQNHLGDKINFYGLSFGLKYFPVLH